MTNIIGFAILLLLIGLFSLLAPRASWYLSIGWKIRNAEPSDVYLIMQRIGGGIACVAAIIIFITLAFGGSDTETVIRDTLKNNQIQSASIQMSPVSPADITKLKSWILASNWKMSSDDNSQVSSFGSVGELDLQLTGNQEIEVFYMGNGQFGISNNGLYPKYVFYNTSLESWFSEHKK